MEKLMSYLMSIRRRCVKEKWLQSCEQQINWNNIPSETVKEY